MVISYSGGKGGDGQVGVSLWRQGQPHGLAGVIQVPSEIRARWDAKQKQARFKDIFEVVAIGPLLILVNFENELRG